MRARRQGNPRWGLEWPSSFNAELPGYERTNLTNLLSMRPLAGEADASASEPHQGQSARGAAQAILVLLTFRVFRKARLVERRCRRQVPRQHRGLPCHFAAFLPWQPRRTLRCFRALAPARRTGRTMKLPSLSICFNTRKRSGTIIVRPSDASVSVVSRLVTGCPPMECPDALTLLAGVEASTRREARHSMQIPGRSPGRGA